MMISLKGKLVLLTTLASLSEASAFEDFEGSPSTRWEYIADAVMGGVSQGQASYGTDGDRSYVQLSGSVSTENNGGFIQIRRLFGEGFPPDTNGLEIEARANNEIYYLFIRTRELTRPWYYYSAPLKPEQDWTTMTVPLDAFERSHAHLNEKIIPADVESLGIVAYGRDHTADISVSALSFY